MDKDAVEECPNCGAKGDEQCHDIEGPPARFVSRHNSRPRLGDSTPLLWEYQGDGLVLCWRNPYNNDAKETVAMMMWPSHAPEKTEEVEQLYERMAATFVCAWNGQTAPAAVDPIPAKLPEAAPEELKPCPFCGGAAQIHRSKSGVWYVECHTDGYCGVSPIADSFPTRAEAIVAWNQRAAAQPDGWIAVERKRLEDVLYDLDILISYLPDSNTYGAHKIKQRLAAFRATLPTPPVQEKP